MDRHEVDHFPDPVSAEEARHKYVAIGQVHLLVLGLVEAGYEASFSLVENRAEDAWRIEVRQAAPVDRTIHAYQRDSMQVANDAIGLDRLIDHFLTDLLKVPNRCRVHEIWVRSLIGMLLSAILQWLAWLHQLGERCRGPAAAIYILFL
jgi:hypothetical protein